MKDDKYQVSRWSQEHLPEEREIEQILGSEGLSYYRWSNGPGDVYSAHAHPYHKVIYVVKGSITFGLPTEGEKVTLNTGDRLELSAGTTHDAVVGPEGVVCLEAHR
jgi:quercetin dioxygenase-like cupin family protein